MFFKNEKGKWKGFCWQIIQKKKQKAFKKRLMKVLKRQDPATILINQQPTQSCLTASGKFT